MIDAEKKGDYVTAENYREAFENCSEYLRERKVQDAEDRHKLQANELEACRQNELLHFNKYWDHKLEEYNTECKRLL